MLFTHLDHSESILRQSTVPVVSRAFWKARAPHRSVPDRERKKERRWKRQQGNESSSLFMRMTALDKPIHRQLEEGVAVEWS